MRVNYSSWNLASRYERSGTITSYKNGKIMSFLTTSLDHAFLWHMRWLLKLYSSGTCLYIHCFPPPPNNPHLGVPW